jgi:hypothetical protein
MRHSLYNKPVPQFFFCSQCDAFDYDKKIIASIKQTSRRYKCIAKHASCIFPTTTMPPKQALKQQQHYGPAPFQKREEGAPRCLAFEEPTNMELEGSVDDEVFPHDTSLPAESNPLITTEQLQAIITSQRKENGILRARNVELQKTLTSKSRTIRYLSQARSVPQRARSASRPKSSSNRGDKRIKQCAAAS